MKKVLVTGGTVFVSRFVAAYYVKKGYDVYVLNRNSRPQVPGVTLIEADRHDLQGKLKGYHFDVVLDITAYTRQDVQCLLAELNACDTYILISSSAVYQETATQPFIEDKGLGENAFWGAYGTNKLAAEQELLAHIPDAYILRPPYLYGPMNNVYREAFVFDCAMAKREFYLPKDGEMKLQFFHVQDLCRFMDVIIEKKPACHIFNVGNKQAVSIREWVKLCYSAAGREPVFRNVYEKTEQRNYFSFYDYEYYLDVSKQYALMEDVTPLEEGLREAYSWYCMNQNQVNSKPFIAFIDANFAVRS